MRARARDRVMAAATPAPARMPAKARVTPPRARRTAWRRAARSWGPRRRKRRSSRALHGKPTASHQMTHRTSMFPQLGAGLGLRREHYQHVLANRPAVDWFEVISENFMVPGGNPRRVLESVRRDYPVGLHGVSVSMGGVDPLDAAYLDQLAALASAVEPAWVSDHLCWGSAHGVG